MSTVETLNSEPELLNNPDKKDNCTCSCHKEPEVSQVENSTIFIVSIDDKPTFYCQTLDEARKQALDYLGIFSRSSEREYYIEDEGKTITLSSSYKFFLVKYDAVETVAKISELSRIQFDKN